ncbi:MAG: hypothetical protein AAGC60_07855 [Acidobacteriota bacterium]
MMTPESPFILALVAYMALASSAAGWQLGRRLGQPRGGAVLGLTIAAWWALFAWTWTSGGFMLLPLALGVIAAGGLGGWSLGEPGRTQLAWAAIGLLVPFVLVYLVAVW